MHNFNVCFLSYLTKNDFKIILLDISLSFSHSSANLIVYNSHALKAAETAFKGGVFVL